LVFSLLYLQLDLQLINARNEPLPINIASLNKNLRLGSLYQKKTGAYDEMIKIGHKVRYYKGSKHISFMDHGYIDPVNPFDIENGITND